MLLFGELALATASFCLEIVPRFRNGITVLIMFQVVNVFKPLPKLQANAYMLVQSRRCVNLYTVLILLTLAEAIFVTCGMPLLQLTKVVAYAKPLMNILGFAYSVLNIYSTVHMIVFKIQCLLNLFAPLQLTCLILTVRMVVCAAVDSTGGGTSLLPYLGEDLNQGYDKWSKLWFSFLCLNLNTNLFSTADFDSLPSHYIADMKYFEDAEHFETVFMRIHAWFMN